MAEHWQDAIFHHWGISGALVPLAGEYDLNFRLTGTSEYVVKVMRPDCDAQLVDLQCDALHHLQRHAPDLPLPNVIPTKDGNHSARAQDETGAERVIWLQSALPGRNYAHVRPHTPDLARQVGTVLGQMDRALRDFESPALNRPLKWNLMEAGWIRSHLDVLSDPARRHLIKEILNAFDASAPMLNALPSQAIHNDANDYNLLVTPNPTDAPRLTGLVDFGDMCRAPRICNIAVAAAYLVLDHPDPEAILSALLAGYHAENPLAPEEITLLWPLLRMRLAVSVVNSTLMAQDTPDDPYVTISQAPAWRFLEKGPVNADLLPARLRHACGLPVTDTAARALAWIHAHRGTFAPVLGQDLTGLELRSVSVEACTVPRNPFAISDAEARTLGGTSDDWFLGYYREPRLIYTDAAFRRGKWKNSNRRTVHLAVDIFAPAGTPVHTPLDAVVELAEYRAGHLDYGGVVVLRHDADGDTFFTLHGHLDPASFDGLTAGDKLTAGTQFAALGAPEVNGGWSPHIHFQLALDTKGMDMDWPGVADPDDLSFWTALCPNPAALLNLDDDAVEAQPTAKADVAQARRARFGANLKLSYRDPVMLVRGWKHHLFDQWGRPYLDAYNNVPHVGHAHPRIQAVAAEELTRFNTNTRYLNPAQNAFADKILSKLPDPLSVCYFVNSGSEANELALRLARAASGGRDMITPDHGYHGNTTGAIDISAYKFNAPGGVGQPDWVHLVEVADDYRGRFRRDTPDCGARYAAQIDTALARITDRGGQLAGFIAETYPSVGGQIIPPDGYLQAVYSRIRDAGGICIADEVQTGLGRLGSHYFAFEQQGVVPDIVVLGKPIGNGHPIGVVITTRAIADAFAQGPEFFSTFGGSTLSSRIGREVLQIVDDEDLMANAAVQGNRLLDGLSAMQSDHPVIGDVRGRGLFIGVDFVTDPETRAPATDLADHAKESLRRNRILVGTEGPADNILKVRPPICIDDEGVTCFLSGFADMMRELTPA